jgi:single-strand DNA-binding protein
MNKVILMGNLTRDPEIRYSQGENSLAIARFSIAVNRRFARQGDTDTDFFNCTAFGRQAEFVEKYFKQGSRMLLTGRVQNDNYTNKNGEKVYSVQIIAEEIEFAERKSTADANAAARNNGNSFGGSAPEPSMAADDDFMNIPDGIEDGLPFN